MTPTKSTSPDSIGNVRLVAREGFSESRTHLLTPYQTRSVPVTLLLVSVVAGGESLAHYVEENQLIAVINFSESKVPFGICSSKKM